MSGTVCRAGVSGATHGTGNGSACAGIQYRFERLTLPIVLGDLRFKSSDPCPGDGLPDFDLPVAGGGRFRSGDAATSGATLLIFGSITCPMTDSAAAGLNALHHRFGGSVRFVMVNVREAHPGKTYPQVHTIETKLARAARLQELHGFAFEIAADEVDGGLHRALSPKPNTAYLIGADRRIGFRAHWANDTRALAETLEAMTAGRAPRPAVSGGLFMPMLRMLKHLPAVLDRAGAWADTWRVAPPLAAIAGVLKALGIRPGRASHGLARSPAKT